MKGRDYKRIVKGIIDKSFPELKDIPVEVKLHKLEKFSMRAKRGLLNRYSVLINPEKYSDATMDQITGGLAHELSHLSIFKKRNYFYFLIDYPLYYFSEKYRTRIENEVDKLAIQKGYAKQLLENRRYRLNKLPKAKRKMFNAYLSSKEIKSYAIEIGKWQQF